MTKVRQIAQVPINFGLNEHSAGHLLGMSCLIRRLVEYMADANPESGKLIAEHLRSMAMEDVKRLEENGIDKSQAGAVIDLTLLPLIQYQIEH